MSVKFLNLQAAYAEIQEEIEEAVLLSLRSGIYIGGPEIERFEEGFAAFVSADHCCGVANGLEALRLGLLAVGIQPGDEVLVPSNTFIATWLAVSQVGAICVPVEPDWGTSNIDPARIVGAITDRTRVIIPVHLYGQPADLDRVIAIAREHGLFVIEDAAQAQGASYRGRRIGAHGDLVAWSFYPGKNLGALGDAGAVTTNNAALADRIRLLRNYGSRERYRNEVQGFNSRLDPVQASALSVKLNHLERWNARRGEIAAAYQAGLSGTGLTLPHVADWAEPAWHLYCVRHPARDRLRALLAEAGVETLIHYPIPPHRQEAYRDAGPWPALPIAERMAAELVSLPIDPMMTDAEVRQTIDTVTAAVTVLNRQAA